jgi:signal transduction histidine kinase
VIKNVDRGHARQPGLRRGSVIVGLIGLFTAMLVLGLGLGAALLIKDETIWTAAVVTLAAGVAVNPLRQRLQRWLLRRADPRRQIAAELSTKYLRQAAADTPYDPPSRNPGHLAQDAIRSAFGDPGAALVLALPGGRGWVDVDDQAAPGPSERLLGHVELVAGSGGQVIAYFVHGSAAEPDAASVAGVVDELRVLIERAVFSATVRDQAELIVEERERAERATLAERVRLERDLHDGVQGRLVALALNLQLARHAVDDPPTKAMLKESVRDLRIALDDLRGLAAGRAPNLLTQQGLAAAIHDLAAKLPRPVRVEVDEGRLDAGTESIAFFVVAEALTNAVKHAEAQHIEARVVTGPASLKVEVTDDGRGGANPAGAGIRGIQARVSLAGGTFAVAERPGGGTVISVDLPRQQGS